jgi:hypothetical protein
MAPFRRGRIGSPAMKLLMAPVAAYAYVLITSFLKLFLLKWLAFVVGHDPAVLHTGGQEGFMASKRLGWDWDDDRLGKATVVAELS